MTKVQTSLVVKSIAEQKGENGGPNPISVELVPGDEDSSLTIDDGTFVLKTNSPKAAKFRPGDRIILDLSKARNPRKSKAEKEAK